MNTTTEIHAMSRSPEMSNAMAMLVHPRQKVRVPAQHLLRQSQVFTDNRMLVSVPYSVTSPVSVAHFRLFISPLEDNAVIITEENFRGLWLLCEEFSFGALRTRLRAFRQSPLADVNLYRSLFDEPFTFTANDDTLECPVAQAAALSTAVREQLSADACVRTFALSAGALNSLRCLLSGFPVSDGWSLGRQLCSRVLELM
jgi:hypothetical protein